MNSDIRIRSITNFYITTIQNWSRPILLPSDVNSLIYFIEGSIKYADEDGNEIICNPGDVIYRPKHFVYSGKSMSKSQTICTIEFDYFDKNIPEIPLPTLTHTLHNKRIEKLFFSIHNNSVIGLTQNKLRAMANLYMLIADLIDMNQLKNEAAPILEPIINYTIDNLSDCDLSVERISERFNISTSQLRRYFTMKLNMSPIEFIRKKRVELACVYLKEQLIPIGEISELCGFSSSYYFSRVFKEIMNCTPSQYKSFCSKQ